MTDPKGKRGSTVASGKKEGPRWDRRWRQGVEHQKERDPWN